MVNDNIQLYYRDVMRTTIQRQMHSVARLQCVIKLLSWAERRSKLQHLAVLSYWNSANKVLSIHAVDWGTAGLRAGGANTTRDISDTDPYSLLTEFRKKRHAVPVFSTPFGEGVDMRNCDAVGWSKTSGCVGLRRLQRTRFTADNHQRAECTMYICWVDGVASSRTTKIATWLTL